MRKITFTLLAFILSLMASCLPTANTPEEYDAMSAEEAALILFSDLTAAEFIENTQDTAFIYNGNSIEGRIKLSGYGISKADGLISLSFDGECIENIFTAEKYSMQGCLNTFSKEFEIEDTSGFADNLEFIVSGNNAELSSGYSRLCYPEKWTIKEGGIILHIEFPEDKPEEIDTELFSSITAEAFDLFPFLPDGTEVKALYNGTAEFSADDNGNWKMTIRSDADGKAVVIEISASNSAATIMYGERNFKVAKTLLLSSSKVPTENEAETNTRKLFEALRSSNILLALEMLMNGSKSDVIKLETEALSENSRTYTAKLILDNYGITASTGLKASGILQLSLSGDTDGNSLEADRYILQSEGLVFIHEDSSVKLYLENIEGPLDGGSQETFTINQNLQAERNGLSLGTPYSGKLEAEGESISF